MSQNSERSYVHNLFFQAMIITWKFHTLRVIVDDAVNRLMILWYYDLKD